MVDFPVNNELLFDVETQWCFHVHCYRSYWERKVVSSHPAMVDKLSVVIQALENPLEIRISKTDSGLYLFYDVDGSRLVCVVARDVEGEGFLMAAYPTVTMKEGTTVWIS